MCERCAVKRRARGSAAEVRRRKAIEEGKDICTFFKRRSVLCLELRAQWWFYSVVVWKALWEVRMDDVTMILR